MGETSLHAALKNYYSHPGDQQEVWVDGYEIDVVQDGRLIEIQTRHFGALRPKLTTLLAHHSLCLVHPIAQEKWIQRISETGELQGRPRKSPRRGRPEHIFSELIRIPDLLAHPNLTLEVLLIQEEDTWRDDGQGSWRRKGWSLADRRLIQVLERIPLHTPADLLRYLPADLPCPFTSQRLAAQAGIPRRLAQQMLYCLRSLNLVEEAGFEKRFKLYNISPR